MKSKKQNSRETIIITSLVIVMFFIGKILFGFAGAIGGAFAGALIGFLFKMANNKKRRVRR